MLSRPDLRLPRRDVPSGGLGVPRRRVRLLALLACRNEVERLPGWLASVAPHVDGVIALDDGSTDGSAELLAERPEVLELIRVPPGRPAWDEVGNHRQLVAAALRQGGGWAIVLDADERVEVDFRARAERVIRRGSLLGFSAYAVKMRELWDSPHEYRVDGLWGNKGPPRLFRLREDHRFDTKPLHASKAPLQARTVRGTVPRADLVVYHLKMIHPGDREARRERYEQADPDARWQPGVGYAYLTDDRGLTLRRVPAERAFVDGQGPRAPTAG